MAFVVLGLVFHRWFGKVEDAIVVETANRAMIAQDIRSCCASDAEMEIS